MPTVAQRLWQDACSSWVADVSVADGHVWWNAVAIANEARLRGIGYTELVNMLSEVFSRAKADYS